MMLELGIFWWAAISAIGEMGRNCFLEPLQLLLVAQLQIAQKLSGNEVERKLKSPNYTKAGQGRH